MSRATSVLLMIVLLRIVPGCVDERDKPDTRVEDKNQELTAALAKNALLEMDMKQIPAGVIVPAPKEQSIEFANAGEFKVGCWMCDLKAKTFSIFKGYPGAQRHSQNEVSGVFQRDAAGKWVAKVTDASSS